MVWKITIERDEGESRTCSHTEESDLFIFALRDCIINVTDEPLYYYVLKMLSYEIEDGSLENTFVEDKIYDALEACHFHGGPALKAAVDGFHFDNKDEKVNNDGKVLKEADVIE